jgi:hypothetical protein
MKAAAIALLNAVLLATTAFAQTPTPAAAPPPGVSASAAAAKTEVSVGETFAVEVMASGPPGTTWSFPAEVDGEVGDLRARPEERPRPDRRTYDAAVFAVTDAVVPPVVVSYRLPDGTSGQVETQPIPLHITSLLPRDPKERQLVDIRPPVDVSMLPRQFWLALVRLLTHSIFGLIVLAALVALGVWLWRRRRRRAVTTAAPVVPQTAPDAEALAALDRLAASPLLAREEYRPFYIALSEIAKRYLERRLEAPVLEMTSAETLGFLRQHAHGSAFVDIVRDVSTAADRIKFARGQGAREMAEGHLGAIRRLVTDLEARLRPVYVEPPRTEPRPRAV